MKAKSRKENMVAAGRAKLLSSVVLVTLALLTAPALSRAGGPSAKVTLYIENITADLDEALKNRNASELKIERIEAFRAGLKLPNDAAADAKAAQALKVTEEALKKTGETISRLEHALTQAEEEMLKSVRALAKGLKWSDVEQDRLANALNKLDSDGDPAATPARKRQVWKEMLSRHGKDFADEASKGAGPSIQSAGAGTQTEYNDCTIFALANAAGVPYGVVAGRAAELLRQGEWRPVASREKPREVIEKKGLIGVEVILLAESLGQAEVVKSVNFTKALKEGRPVLANVTPQNGGSGGHQVVLTKTFEHKGATWYEMMDSNQGATQRLYLSEHELNIILQENGIAFRPETGQRPVLLRQGL